MSEWIGLIVSVVIFLYLMLRKMAPSKDEDRLEDFLESLEQDMAAKKKPAPPAPKPVKAKVFVPPPKPPEVEKQGIVSSYFEKGVQYDVIGKATPSRAHRLLENLKDRRDMVILHEIIGPPKCKRR